MRHIYYILPVMLICISGVEILAQYRHDAQMVMGYWGNDPVLQFRPDSVQIEYQSLAFDMVGSSSNISDKEGNLLFYYNGCSMSNADHEIMENGTGFNPGKDYDNFCRDSTSAYGGSDQSSLILPLDNKDSLFMLLHITSDYYYIKDTVNLYGIPRYSIVDMKANSGKGRVILKNQMYHPDTTMQPGAFTAVRHANNRDWWIINPDEYWSNTIYTTLLRDGALIPTGSQDIGPKWGQYYHAGFSPDGSKYFRYSNYRSGLSVMDFDRETGLFSHERHLPVSQANIFALGGSFSPSGRYIYIGNGPYLMQIDAEAEELVADTIAVWDGTVARWGQPAYFGAMQIGPDCRIYMAPGFCVPFMHVIMEPDKPGKACDVRQHFFTLETPICYVPHFPNYRLGTGYPYCDPDIKVVTSTNQHVAPYSDDVATTLYPNPADNRVTIRSSHVIRSVSIIDMTGRTVIIPEQWPDTVWEADVSRLPEGVYWVRIDHSGKERTIFKKLIILR